MQEFTTVSSSSYDPAALASKLNEKSAEGWDVVSIVSTGGDVTAFLSRAASGTTAAAAESATGSTGSSSDSSTGSLWGVGATAATVASADPEPTVVTPVSEPAGWGVAPESTSSTAASAASSAASVEPTQASSAPAAPAASPTPSVPAGWYADPAGRYELRYWDGGTWTEHVSRAGQQYTDPPVA